MLAGAAVLLAAGLTGLSPRAATATAATTGTMRLDADLFAAWRKRFVADDGRVVDDGNGGISHSEGQGYGMLLAAFADDRDGFARMWDWTRAHLARTDDALFSWRYDPKTAAPVSDPNNATDGDLLIAWALAEAGSRWQSDAARLSAAGIARAVLRGAVVETGGKPVILPGASGFRAGDRRDGPVINLSYWVFPAFPALADVVPEYDWRGLAASGLDLARRGRFGKQDLPPDWTALGGDRLRPANGFDPVFGWNALRVPLYLAMADLGDFGGSRADLAPYAALWPAGGARDPEAINLLTGKTVSAFGSSGYRAVPALVACALDGTPWPAALSRFEDEPYYPATLRLLALAAARTRYPECF
ncbi:glycosyl hydrolase family 8 [Methylobrevis pamukkalensis]